MFQSGVNPVTHHLFFDELYGIFIPSHGVTSPRFLYSQKQNITNDKFIQNVSTGSKSKYGDEVRFHSTYDFLYFAGNNGCVNTLTQKKGKKNIQVWILNFIN